MATIAAAAARGASPSAPSPASAIKCDKIATCNCPSLDVNNKRNNNESYSGIMKHGVFHGKGKYIKESGEINDGYWNNGKWLGGIIYLADGTKIDGKWENGLRFVHGVVHRANGTREQGDFKDMKLIKGKRNNPDGTVEHIGGESPSPKESPKELDSRKKARVEVEDEGPASSARAARDHAKSLGMLEVISLLDVEMASPPTPQANTPMPPLIEPNMLDGTVTPVAKTVPKLPVAPSVLVTLKSPVLPSLKLPSAPVTPLAAAAEAPSPASQVKPTVMHMRELEKKDIPVKSLVQAARVESMFSSQANILSQVPQEDKDYITSNSKYLEIDAECTVPAESISQLLATVSRLASIEKPSIEAQGAYLATCKQLLDTARALSTILLARFKIINSLLAVLKAEKAESEARAEKKAEEEALEAQRLAEELLMAQAAEAEARAEKKAEEEELEAQGLMQDAGNIMTDQ